MGNGAAMHHHFFIITNTSLQGKRKKGILRQPLTALPGSKKNNEHGLYEARKSSSIFFSRNTQQGNYSKVKKNVVFHIKRNCFNFKALFYQSFNLTQKNLPFYSCVLKADAQMAHLINSLFICQDINKEEN